MVRLRLVHTQKKVKRKKSCFSSDLHTLLSLNFSNKVCNIFKPKRNTTCFLNCLNSNLPSQVNPLHCMFSILYSHALNMTCTWKCTSLVESAKNASPMYNIVSQEQYLKKMTHLSSRNTFLKDYFITQYDMTSTCPKPPSPPPYNIDDYCYPNQQQQAVFVFFQAQRKRRSSSVGVTSEFGL